MAADVDVQYFSHLNGLVLDNKWGDMIRLLDACLVNGVELPSVTSASIDEQGDVHLTLFAPHKAMLLQVVELTDFEPASLNQKYRIKGVPSDTQLILKPHVAITETVVTTKGTSKLASLGYDIVFRDDKDVKRVYRAKNPTVQHPYIRVDETISDGTNSYNSSYAKSAMVGLLEHMDHIDDYQDPNVLQLPFDPENPSKNWTIEGNAGNCIRGWFKWHWAYMTSTANYAVQEAESNGSMAGNRAFTLCGNHNFFIGSMATTTNIASSRLIGCGIYDTSLPDDVIKPWFLMAMEAKIKASDSSLTTILATGGNPIAVPEPGRGFISTRYSPLTPLSAHIITYGITYNSTTGRAGAFGGSAVPALTIPIFDTDGFLKGKLPCVCYSGRLISGLTPLLSENSMYVASTIRTRIGSDTGPGGVYFYLGELA